MKEKIKVACCQLALRVGEAEHNRALSAQAIRRAAQRGANVIVLPELVNSGYVLRDKAEARALAEAEDGPSLSLWGALARELDVAIVAGFCERLPDGEVANSAALIDAQGVRAIYRKAHLWHEESTIFTAGDRPPPVIETRFGRLAVMICYDLEFPEWVRLPALAGAQLLCAPVNWPLAPRPQGERPAEMVKAQANAAVNRLFIAVCDRCETERGVAWIGGSVIVDGYPLTQSLAGEGMVLASMDIGSADDKHIGRHNHVHRDRRPMLY
ncbi:nitrilase-related carbon-nitrogen hydrolase [Serratia marcescens]|uniref:nitrilase-related carbon-nitrogen hydrolase n=1 Tax=Serratia marcescens TaxID=615 RepID=UPI00307D45CA